MEWIGAEGQPLGRSRDTATVPAAAVKAKVHYRVEGKSKKPTFSGPCLAAQVAAFQALLAAAYANDWVADAKGHPVPPVALPTAGAPAAGLELPSAVSGSTPADVQTIAAWFKDRHRSTSKKRGGDRSPTTTGGYDNNLDFFLAQARYAPGDSRLESLDVDAGTPWRLDDAGTGVNEVDLLRVLEIRAATNLRTRGQNERRMAAWAKQVEAEERKAARQNRPPVLPAPPALRREAASARTVEAFAQQVRSMFTTAYKYGKIAYNPWTASVDDEVPHATHTAYTQKSLPHREQVAGLAAGMQAARRTSTTADGHRVEVTGARYSAMVWLAGREGPRPEETVAIRDSWVRLDDGDPRVELHGAEVYHPKPDGPGRVRTEVPLKHRQTDEIRVLRPEPEDAEEFVRILSEHRRQHVATPDPTSSDPEERDPHFFTTHSGRPIDLSNWTKSWWHGVVRATFDAADSEHLATLPFRKLRAAAVTDWLVVLGYTTAQAATKAGNSQAVIENHYKGVLDARPPLRIRSRGDQPGIAELTEALRQLGSADLGTLTDALKVEHHKRIQGLDFGT